MKVVAVATELPQIAPKPPQPTMVAMANPPRNRPISALAKRYRSCDRPEAAAMLPISRNSGMVARSELVSTSVSTDCGSDSAASVPMIEATPTIPASPMAMPMGT